MNKYKILQAVIFHRTGHFTIADVDFLNQESFGPINNIAEYRQRLKRHYHYMGVNNIILNYEETGL